MPISSTTPASFPLYWMLVLVDVLGGAFRWTRSAMQVSIGGMPRFLSIPSSAAVGMQVSCDEECNKQYPQQLQLRAVAGGAK